MFSPCKEMEAARGRSPQPSAPEKRGPGRPRLPTPERRRNVLASKAKWRLENHEYYLNQKRELASRPEYLTRRRELRAIKRTCIWQDVTAGACGRCGGGATGTCGEVPLAGAWGDDTSPQVPVAGVGPPCGPVPDDARKSILDYATLDNIQIAYSSKMDVQPP